eukprot:4826570-Amphidinium_carterae.2
MERSQRSQTNSHPWGLLCLWADGCLHHGPVHMVLRPLSVFSSIVDFLRRADKRMNIIKVISLSSHHESPTPPCRIFTQLVHLKAFPAHFHLVRCCSRL